MGDVAGDLLLRPVGPFCSEGADAFNVRGAVEPMEAFRGAILRPSRSSRPGWSRSATCQLPSVPDLDDSRLEARLGPPQDLTPGRHRRDLPAIHRARARDASTSPTPLRVHPPSLGQSRRVQGTAHHSLGQRVAAVVGSLDPRREIWWVRPLHGRESCRSKARRARRPWWAVPTSLRD